LTVLTGTPTSASNAVIRINGNVFEGMEWEVTEESSTYDSSSFEDGVFEDEDVASVRCTVRIKGIWDRSRNPHASPLLLNAGVTITNLNLYINGLGGGLQWRFPKALCKGSTTTAKVHDGLPIEINFRSKGQYFPPGA
jgi:hypothetical protein